MFGVGVSLATSAVAAATVPEAAPWRKRSPVSWSTFCERPISPTAMPPPTIARISIGLRPYRSASAPQSGLVAARLSPVTLAEIPVQNAS